MVTNALYPFKAREIILGLTKSKLVVHMRLTNRCLQNMFACAVHLRIMINAVVHTADFAA